MKTRNALVVLAVALLVAPVPRLLAQTGTGSVDPYGMRQLNLDLFEKQTREASEREGARALSIRLSAATYDLNHDGKLDAKEFAAWEKEVRAVAETSPRVLKKYDKNHDKKLDDKEWAAARKEIIPD